MDFWKFIYKHNRKLLLLLGLYISFGPRGANTHWVNPRKCSGGLPVVINYKWNKEELCVIMSKNIGYQLNFGSNEDDEAASLLTCHGDNIV